MKHSGFGFDLSTDLARGSEDRRRRMARWTAEVWAENPFPRSMIRQMARVPSLSTPPLRTGHAVLPHTAHRHRSSRPALSAALGSQDRARRWRTHPAPAAGATSNGPRLCASDVDFAGDQNHGLGRPCNPSPPSSRTVPSSATEKTDSQSAASYPADAGTIQRLSPSIPNAHQRRSSNAQRGSAVLP